MSWPSPAALALLAAFALAPRVQAIGQAEDFGPRFFGGTPAMRGTCQALVSTAPPDRPPVRPATVRLDEPSTDDLRACLQLLRTALSGPTLGDAVTGGTASTSEESRHRQLLHTFRAVERIAPWVQWADRRLHSPVLIDELAALEAVARLTLRAHGLLGGSYAAAATGGVEVAEPGGQVGAPPGASVHGQTTGFARLDAETRPLGIGLGWDANLGLRVGRQPILAMVKTAGGAAEPAYRSGVDVSSALRFARTSRVTEVSAVGRVGARRLDLSPTVLSDGGLPALYAPAVNDIDEWALYFDASLELRWYDRDVWVERLAMRTLDPLVRAAVGIRHDERFHRMGDLGGFDDPTARVFFGFAVHPVRAGAFSVGAGFEFEGALRGPQRLPSGFRGFVEGTVDLRRAWRGHRAPE